jgi:hypothetical protein
MAGAVAAATSRYVLRASGRKMRIMIDTNIVLDVLLKREPFFL